MSKHTAPKAGATVTRELQIRAETYNEETGTVEVAFSSETPVERYWGIEILDHSADSVRLGRLNGGGAVLVNHDLDDQVGVVSEARIEPDRKGRALLRFGRSQRAQEIAQDVKDGIRTLISVSYIVHRWDVAEAKTGPSTYRAMDWEPLEISFVSVPADPTVGVGRSLESPADEPATIEPQIEAQETEMTEEVKPAPTVDLTAERHQAAEQERSRVREILALGAKFGMEDAASRAVEAGTELETFRRDLLSKLDKPAPVAQDPGLGMSEREVQRFSFLRAVNALMHPGDRKAQEAAGYEREVSEAAAAANGKTARGFVIPVDVLQRDLITGTGTGTAKGGNLIQTDVMGGSFIDVLRNAMVLPSVGARFMTGLQGNVAIPKRTTSVTAYWPGENTAPTEGTNVFSQVTMSPKTLAAYVDVGRRLAVQSSVDAEMLVRDDLAITLGLAIEAAALGGATTNGPTGVRGTSGIGSVAMGTNGGAPTWASVTALSREVEVDNALIGSAAYITNAKVKDKLANTPRQSSGVEGNFILSPPFDSLYGYPIRFTNTVPANLTKGTSTSVCSAMLFGVWSNLIVGQWGGIELISDPYSLSTTGATRIVALSEVDVCVRYPEAFAAVLDYTTT